MTVNRRTKLRTHTMLGVCLLVALSLISACSPRELGYAALNFINKDRQARGLHELRWDDNAADKAQAWAERLAARRTIEHSRLTDGIAGAWSTLGENVGFSDSIGGAHVGFMNSPKHRAAILGGQFSSAGVGVATNGNLVFVVQVFRG